MSILSRIILIVVVILYAISIYREDKSLFRSIPTLFKLLFGKWKILLIFLAVFFYFLSFKKDIPASISTVAIYVIYIGCLLNLRNDKIKAYKNERGFSINIGINIEELLKDGILKNIYDKIFKEEKTFSGLTRAKLEKALLDNQYYYHYFKNILGKPAWTNLHFDIIGEDVFFNDKPVPYGKIIGYLGIPYNNTMNEYEVDGLKDGLKIRAIVVNGLLKVQMEISGYGKEIEVEKRKKYITEQRFDIAIFPIEDTYYWYPLNKNQYNPSQQILLEDIKDGIYGDFYKKHQINNNYLADIDAEKYLSLVREGDSYSTPSEGEYIRKKVESIKKINQMDYSGVAYGNNKYVRISLTSYEGTGEEGSLSRYHYRDFSDLIN